MEAELEHLGAAPSTNQAPTPAECLAQGRTIVDSPHFDATARERRFLAYIVEECVAGNGGRIKAYNIATQVFGRDSTFDAQNDPIVRIAAGHLRRALERYYLTEGAFDPIVISVPKGGYVPTFRFRTASELPAEGTKHPENVELPLKPSRRNRFTLVSAGAIVLVALAIFLGLRGSHFLPTAGGPEPTRLLVEPFDDLGGTLASSDITTGLTQEIIGQLSRFRDIVVVEGDQNADSSTIASPRYALLGSVWLTPEAFRLRVRLISRVNGEVLWSDSYDGGVSVSEVLQAQNAIAENVATSLAQVNGVILQADARAILVAPPDDWTAYACTLSFYSYRETMSLAAGERALNCLERAVAQRPDYATAWALLALAKLDRLRLQFPHNSVEFEAEIDQILNHARRASSLDPQNVRALQAEMFALFLSGRHAEGRSVGERALAQNRNDTELLGEYGYRMALSGSWDEGCPLMREARDRNPGPLVYYETGLALCSYFAGNLDEAKRLILQTGATGHPLYHLIAAAICGEARDMVCADQSRRWLEANSPELVENVQHELLVRLGNPEDVDYFIGSLVKADVVKTKALPLP